ncbi:SRPBCC family protein [Rhodococcus sp. NPDC058521]|uniref:SRPBCC family protein n=1 Tax=Rhodococcus sp. NPDC058521 TaxID=3346536 RepID=UPI00366712C9
MPRTLTVSDSIVVNTDPATMYAHISDPTRMGNWSPENTGATVLDGGGDTHVGMTFEGHNKRGGFGWTTRCVVTAADPGERFAFEVRAIGVKKPRLTAPIATWEYRFEQVEGGTEVTETWTDDRRSWPDLAANIFDKIVTRGKVFADFQRKNIEITLRNLKREMEKPSA